jgi:uncharacterized Ntn-hydrolase superfamily protein
MTFSIIARCPTTGRLGLGITTFSIAAGGRCEGIRHGVGICKTQAYVKRDNDLLAIDLLEQGFEPAAVMQQLEHNDPDHAWRQIAILDRLGKAAAHTGSGTRPWSGHHVGDGFVAFGNVLAGRQVIDGIVNGFLADPSARWNSGCWPRSKAAATPAARSATRATCPSDRRRSSWSPSRTMPTSTCASTA